MRVRVRVVHPLVLLLPVLANLANPATFEESSPWIPWSRRYGLSRQTLWRNYSSSPSLFASPQLLQPLPSLHNQLLPPLYEQLQPLAVEDELQPQLDSKSTSGEMGVLGLGPLLQMRPAVADQLQLLTSNQLQPLTSSQLQVLARSLAPALSPMAGRTDARLDQMVPLVGMVQSVMTQVMQMSETHQGVLLGGQARPYAEPPPSQRALIQSRGYPYEKHVVRTDDGYLLTLVRIPGAPGSIPVLVQHGMLSSSDGWLLRTDNSNLAFILHDAGYDVWLGNYRGNTHSRRHEYLNVTDYSFWNFSWHEMGLLDLPAMIDYIIGATGFPSIQYIGHSMGSTGMMVLLSSRPEYNEKIRLASFLAPVAYVSRLQGPFFNQLATIARPLKDWLIRNKVWDVLPRTPLLHKLANCLCIDGTLTGNICNSIVFEVFGTSPLQALKRLVPTLTAFQPAGTTIRIMEHYYTTFLRQRFRPLGEGMDDPNPGPDYNVSAISAPVALYYSRNDLLVYPSDVDYLASKLPNVVLKFLVPHRYFNHLDFMWARDARTLLYRRVLDTMAAQQAQEEELSLL